ncbi:hypothetical protein L6164_037898 [Bauhinia variegata]|nr:hypothetical protein L6164_037898 [Bauhinia variegata]
MSDSLVRVSRRAEWGARRPTPGARGAEARHEGACCKPRSRRRHVHEHINSPGLGRRRNPRRSGPESIGGPAHRRSTSDRDASPAPIRFPPGNFKHSLTLFSKSFSSFPRGTCSLSVSRQYLALDGIYRPIWAAFSNNPTRRQRLVVRQGPSTTGLSPSLAPPSRGLGPGPSLRTLLQTTIRTPRATDFHGGLFPRVIPPDLGSRWKHPSDAMGSCEPFDGRGTQDWLREELNHRVPWCSPPRTRIWANRESSSREANLRPTHDVCWGNDV